MTHNVTPATWTRPPSSFRGLRPHISSSPSAIAEKSLCTGTPPRDSHPALMATKITLPALPPSLLLLVHLHLLEYPHADRSEYDHNVFNPKTRGLKDRTKTMEDISYFLVRKLERDRVKTVSLPVEF